MAITSGSLKGRLVGKLTALVLPFYTDEVLIDDERLDGYTLPNYIDRLSQAIAEAVVEEIHAGARATGTDTPSGDFHDLPIL